MIALFGWKERAARTRRCEVHGLILLGNAKCRRCDAKRDQQKFRAQIAFNEHLIRDAQDTILMGRQAIAEALTALTRLNDNKPLDDLGAFECVRCKEKRSPMRGEPCDPCSMLLELWHALDRVVVHVDGLNDGDAALLLHNEMGITASMWERMRVLYEALTEALR